MKSGVGAQLRVFYLINNMLVVIQRARLEGAIVSERGSLTGIGFLCHNNTAPTCIKTHTKKRSL